MRFLIVMLILISCNSTEIKPSNDSYDSDTLPAKKITEKQPKKTLQTWVGTINNNIPVFVWFTMQDSIVHGELAYTNAKNKTSIKLIGTFSENDGFRIFEFEKSGNITGILTGRISDKEFNGIWFSPKLRKELVLDLNFKDTILNNKDKNFESDNIAGKYRYIFSDEGPEGIFVVKQKEKKLISFEFSNVTAPPAYNVAEVTADSVELIGNECIYTLPDYGSCKFRIRFFKNFAVVDYLDDQYDCGFASNASIDGVYFKVKN